MSKQVLLRMSQINAPTLKENRGDVVTFVVSTVEHARERFL